MDADRKIDDLPTGDDFEAFLEAANATAKDQLKPEVPLEPSSETLLLLSSIEGLTPRQRKLLEIGAFFLEKAVDTGKTELKLGKFISFSGPAKEEVVKELDDLDTYYEYHIPAKSLEFDAAQQFVAGLDDTLLIFEKNNQTLSFVWGEIARRVGNFQLPMLLAEAKDPMEKQHIVAAANHVKASIIARYPNLVLPSGHESDERNQQISALFDEAIKNPQGLTAEEENELDKSFDKFLDHAEQHYKYEERKINVDPKKALFWRQELKQLIKSRGIPKKLVGGLKLELSGNKVENRFGGKIVELWETPDNFPVHILIQDIFDKTKPERVSIDWGGNVLTGIGYYDDDPESIARATKMRQLPDKDFIDLITSAIEFAKAPKP